jgi:dolichol-phosphate mannosyltransferase
MERNLDSNEYDDTARSELAAQRNHDRFCFSEIAVIVPVYMGKAVLGELCRRLIASLETITRKFAIILVDDRSPDDAWPLIRELGGKDRRIKGIRLSRNFGQHYALTAGIDYARARWYCVMDCDLQDAPEDIPALYQKAINGYDIVVGIRRKEGHGLIKRYTSRLFYRTFNILAGIDLEWNVGNFRIFSHQVASGIRQMREQMRFLPASFKLMGYDVGAVSLAHYPRQTGRSSYDLKKLVKLAANTVLAHSDTPLKWATVLGLIISFSAFAAAILLMLRKIIWGISVVGWTSLIVAVFVVGGIQIFITGIVGIYVGKCLDEAKRRPLYFIKETLNFSVAEQQLLTRRPDGRAGRTGLDNEA